MPNGNHEIETPVSDRLIKLGRGTTPIPERLLLAHAKGQVLFVTGAGISMFEPAGLPDFRGLAMGVYKELDPPTYEVLSQGSNKKRADTDSFKSMIRNLNNEQMAEILRFCDGDYDVVLGMLERRLDRSSDKASKVRDSVGKILRANTPKPAPIHRALMRLADRGSSTTIVTTNFDLLLEDASRSMRSSTQSYALGGIPRPTQSPEFGGIMHIHGALNRSIKRVSDLILTDRDLGEFYLRRRIVPDLIYDAARLYNLVLVGYSANDPPMRYLLNAVAADRERFTDLKERFIFIDYEDENPIEIADMKARGLTPIPYKTDDGSHLQLENTLIRWAELSAINGDPRRFYREIKRITNSCRMQTDQADCDLFDFFVRRSHTSERNQISRLLSSKKADPDWLDALTEVSLENVPNPDLMSFNNDTEFRNKTAVDLVFLFLRGRLRERSVLSWAIESKSHKAIKQSAVKLLLEVDGATIKEPWRTAWRMTEETWYSPIVDTTSIYYLRDRLSAGERTNSLVTAIVDLVKASIAVKSKPYQTQAGFRIRSVHDLVEVSLNSGDLVDPKELELNNLVAKDRRFLVSLANELDSAVTSGLENGRRVGWTGDDHFWLVGGLYRVEYDKSVTNIDIDEPDAVNNGIAPSVKLLHEVVTQLINIDVEEAMRIMRRWKTYDDSVHLRLWAALSKDSRVTDASEVGEFILGLNDRQFWLTDDYPEIAEVRAQRFNELEYAVCEAVVTKICKSAPLTLWPRNTRDTIDEKDRIILAAIELKRIQSVGGKIPNRGSMWLESVTRKYPELSTMSVTDLGYRSGVQVQYGSPSPDSIFDDLTGINRLTTLEEKLSKSGGGRGNGAATWMRGEGKAILVINDFETIGCDMREFPRVWEHLGWSHSPWTEQGEYDRSRDLSKEADRVISLLLGLYDESLGLAIGGIINWLDTWREIIVEKPNWAKAWLRVWPIVQEITNGESQSGVFDDDRRLTNRNWLDMDTLNTPEGKMIEVFLAACRNLKKDNKVYIKQGYLIDVRDGIAGASGRSKFRTLIRLTIGVDYFLDVDSDWTKEHLIARLRDNSMESLAMWQIVSRVLRSTKLLELVGEDMISRAMDSRLDRQVRQDLAYNVVFESLHAFQNKRASAIDNIRIQQMLRTVDDETRAFCARMVSRFLSQLSGGGNHNQESAGTVMVFRNAIKPFFDQVWPKEQSFVTPDVSKGLASLPARANGAFAEALDVISHLLVPFDCRSLYVYGLRSTSDNDENSRLSMINNHEKAQALLVLLDRTIGTEENTVHPYELSEALEQIEKVNTPLARSRAFRRLTALTRR